MGTFQEASEGFFFLPFATSRSLQPRWEALGFNIITTMLMGGFCSIVWSRKLD